MERRNHPRSNLRLPVFMVRSGHSDPIQTRTENVSKDGFFAFVDCPLMPGETLKFLILLPDVSEAVPTASRLCVHGELQVMRTFSDCSGERVGVGCRLTSYRVLPDLGTLVLGDLVKRVLNLGTENECVRPN